VYIYHVIIDRIVVHCHILYICRPSFKYLLIVSFPFLITMYILIKRSFCSVHPCFARFVTILHRVSVKCGSPIAFIANFARQCQSWNLFFSHVANRMSGGRLLFRPHCRLNRIGVLWSCSDRVTRVSLSGGCRNTS